MWEHVEFNSKILRQSVFTAYSCLNLSIFTSDRLHTSESLLTITERLSIRIFCDGTDIITMIFSRLG